MRIFSQISGSHASREVYNRDKTKNKHAHSATKDTREAKKRLADEKLKKKMKRSKKKTKADSKKQKSKTEDANRDTTSGTYGKERNL